MTTNWSFQCPGNSGPPLGQSTVIDIELTGGGTAQCMLFVSITDSLGERADQEEAVSTAVDTAAGTFGTVTSNNVEINTGQPTSALVSDPLFITLPIADSDLYYAYWTPDSDFTAFTYLLVPANGALTDTQISSLVSAMESEITSFPSGSGVTVSQVTIAPSSLSSTNKPVISYSSVCSANYTSTTAGDLDGTSISVVVTKANSTITATGVFDMQSGTATGACAGIFNWNGTDQAGRAGVGGPVGTRSTAQQTWIVTGVSPGTYTAKLRGSVNTGGTIRSTNTTLSINVS